MTKVDAKQENVRIEQDKQLAGGLPGVITDTPEGNLGGKEEDKKSKKSDNSK